MNDFLTLVGLNGGRWAAFWGGIASDLPEFAIFVVLWRKVNCHAKGCWRVGLHRVDGTPYITCKRHHPALPGTRSATVGQIADAHAAAHQAGAAGVAGPTPA